MVRYVGKDGTEYILRFDMSAMEEMKECFTGGYVEGLQKIKTGEREMIQKVFAIMANAGAEYMAEMEHRPMPERIDGANLLGRHSSVGRLRGMVKAIEEAVADGNRMQTKDEEDDAVRDGYLEEYRELERKSGKN